MRKGRNLIFYISTLAIFGAGMYWIAISGKALESDKSFRPIADPKPADFGQLFQDSVGENLTHPLAILLLQVVAIIAFARLFGFLFNKIGQPTVMGEIIAGIVLGPSVVGLFFPEASHFLFPTKSLGNLQFLSQFGLMLFMFVIGMELDVKVLKNKAHDAVVISHASIIIPYALGMVLAYFMYNEFAPADIPFLSFALFMGIAMSITAFPVLARIIQERRLTRSRLGAIAITCAAADDVTAWCILAAVIAIVKAGNFTSALFTIGLSLIYVLFMLYVVQPFLRRLSNIYQDKESLSKPVMAIIFMIMLLSAYATEIIGIHALFGAFLAGVVIPPDMNFRKNLIDKIEDVSLVLLLPLFFVFTGLRTQIGLLNDAHLWATCGWIVLVAVAGKFGGSMIAARIVGQNWRNSLSIGALMNTRGLMELIVLNIGYDLGILSPSVFAMMVIMAIVTTFMTGPAMDLINYIFLKKSARYAAPRKVDYKGYRILLSFGLARSGRKLLRLAAQMLGRKQEEMHITALHLTYNADLNPLQLAEFEKESFRPMQREARSLGINIESRYKPVMDIRKEITKILTNEPYDFLLVDAGKSLLKGTVIGNLFEAGKVFYPGNLLRTLSGNKKLLPQLFPADDMMDERAKNFVEDARCNIGVFFERNFENADKILIPVLSVNDITLLPYARRFVQNNSASISVMDNEGLTSAEPQWQQAFQERPNAKTKIKFQQLVNVKADKALFANYDVVLVSYESWTELIKTKRAWVDMMPSVLVIKHIAQTEPVIDVTGKTVKQNLPEAQE